MRFTDGLLLTTILALYMCGRFPFRGPRFCPNCKEVRLQNYRDLEQFQGSCTYATCPVCGKHVCCGSDSNTA